MYYICSTTVEQTLHLNTSNKKKQILKLKDHDNYKQEKQYKK